MKKNPQLSLSLFFSLLAVFTLHNSWAADKPLDQQNNAPGRSPFGSLNPRFVLKKPQKPVNGPDENEDIYQLLLSRDPLASHLSQIRANEKLDRDELAPVLAESLQIEKARKNKIEEKRRIEEVQLHQALVESGRFEKARQKKEEKLKDERRQERDAQHALLEVAHNPRIGSLEALMMSEHRSLEAVNEKFKDWFTAARRERALDPQEYAMKKEELLMEALSIKKT